MNDAVTVLVRNAMRALQNAQEADTGFQLATAEALVNLKDSLALLDGQPPDRPTPDDDAG
jgi:hypothetical protein